MIYDSILEAVGRTPLLRLNRLAGPDDARVLVKFEGLNVGGSVKTRTALNMILDGEKRGLLHRDSVIVEPTSGNQGIGLALVGAVRGYRVKIIMPDSVSLERRKLIKLYGAEILLVHDEGNIGRCIESCIALARRLQAEDANVFLPQQFENPANPEIHVRTTGSEILEQADGPIHGFCAGIGTGGTLTGVGTVLKQANPGMRIWAVEPEKAAILSGGPIGSHIQMGIGDGLIPPVLNQKLIDRLCLISDTEALETTRLLAAREGIACGITGGTNVAAALKLARHLGPGKTVVTVLPDTAERYYSTELFQ